ncbi:MAG: hypothetical protein PHN57_03720 [Candidatus Omnitrophica bacterium]|nr:hypothetical protein [Candidatus Omnitrophota bacterium]
MIKKTLTNKLLLVTGLCLTLVFSYSNAFAWGHEGGRYHYHGGRWYGRGWFGIEFAIPSLRIGAVVDSLPFGYTTIVVGGIPYYCYDRVYYRPYPAGYIVVPEPAVVPVVPAAPVVVAPPAMVQPQAPSQATVTINVPNSSGGYTPVTLIKRGEGYIGPQGEYYAGNPTVEQLRVLYGK